MSVVAEFEGECWDCGGRIRPGQHIENVPEDTQRLRGWAHVECPADFEAVADAAALAQPRCARCGLNHPGKC